MSDANDMLMAAIEDPSILGPMLAKKAAESKPNADKQGSSTVGPEVEAAQPAASVEQPATRPLRTVEDAPPWFGVLLVHMLALYPALQVHPNALLAWWFHLRGLAPQALEAAFSEAPKQCEPLTVPSCEMVRRLAEQWRPVKTP